MAQKSIDFDLKKTLKRMGRGWSVAITDVNVTRAKIHGHTILFCTDRYHDPIQDRNRSGHFYEMEELEVILRYFPLGGVIFDIGANVGNHTLFFATLGNASKVISIEPNPLAYKLLVSNVALNGLNDVVDLSKVGLGLSDVPAKGYAMEERKKNLGGARMLQGEGDIEVDTGDNIFAGEIPSMIKIDVEGMELKVLAGLDKTINEHRPVIFVEVDRRNDDAFQTWLSEVDYQITQTFQRYKANKNYLICPN